MPAWRPYACGYAGGYRRGTGPAVKRGACTPTSSIETPSRESLLLRPRVGKQELSYATGFIVTAAVGPLLITSRHVVTRRDQSTGKPLSSTGAIPDHILIHHNGAEKDDKGIDTVVIVSETLSDQDGSPRWIQHPSLAERADIVALPLTRLDGVAIQPVTITGTENPISCRPGEMVSVVGYPFGIGGPGSLAIWATGFIASEIGFLWNGLPVVLIDCRSRPGQSGSPVFAYRTGLIIREDGQLQLATHGSAAYRFLGVYSGRIHPESDIGMVWNAESVGQLVNSVSSS